MGLQNVMLTVLIAASIVTLTIAIPTSLVEEIKSSEFRNNKVKRQHPSELLNSEENEGDVSYYNKPSAIKRGGNDLKSSSSDQSSSGDWDQDQSILNDRNNLQNIPASLYNSPENTYDDKTISDYEKGFRYGSNKDRIDEAVENAILKSELYGEPSAINQYRYYGADDKKRRRRNVKRFAKRQDDLTPDEVLALLSLYENNLQRQSANDNYQRANFNQDLDLDQDDDSQEQDNDVYWLNSPVYPHASENDHQDDDQVYEKKKKWGGLSEDRKKKFMVARKRIADPTRELRYLNGPNKNDFYTLSQLLSNQREPNIPVYRRFVL